MALVAAAVACRREGPTVAFLGDSLTAGWRLPESLAFPAPSGEREVAQTIAG